MEKRQNVGIKSAFMPMKKKKVPSAIQITNPTTQHKTTTNPATQH